ncbi:hypothetical protein ON010_g7027 [Phytophthora cinnamomi]|nr:hypothetical protein ON010_g7027 [Phytophthora cinnamomi]
MANSKTVVVPKRTMKLTISIEGMEPYTAELLLLPVPEGKQILLGMPWLRAEKPRIDWRTGSTRPSMKALQARLAALIVPAEVPPVANGLHKIDVESDKPVFRQQWGQLPAQEAEITKWVREMEAIRYVRRSPSPHGAPTFCVRKSDGWRIVHDFRAMNGNRRTVISWYSRIDWTHALTKHFEQLKEKIVKTPVLAIPDFRKDFFMRGDASDFAREFGLRTWRIYLLDRPFVVETDHKSLETVFKQKSISRHIARWYDELAEYQFQIRYIKGATNTVADGISRRPGFMGSNEPVTLAAITSLTEAVRRYDDDDTTKVLLHLLDPAYTADKDETIHDIAKYVKGCEICARTKARNERPPDLFNSHDIPAQRWSHIAMDFITELLSTPRDYDSMMVVIDHLTKRAHFVAGKGTDSSSDVAEQYHKEIFRLHGLSNVLCEMLGVKQKMTTAFRTQGDRDSERLNQTLENYISAFSNAASEDWDLYLCLAGFAYDARFQSSINMSPFEEDIAYIPRIPGTLHLPSGRGDTCQPKHSDFVARQADILAKARRSISDSQDRMTEYYNKNRKTQKFDVGDKVFLSDQHIVARHIGKKRKRLELAGSRRSRLQTLLVVDTTN